MDNIKFNLFGNAYTPLFYLGILATEGISAHASQSGEDITLARLFQKKTDGFYIDVGAFHPILYSNTYMFHKLFDWRGLNIDASEKTIELYNMMRPKDINLNVAVSNVEGKTTYWQFDNSPSVNTISQENVDRQLSRGIELTQQRTIDTYRLETIFDQYLPEGQVIDLMNVDVEGVDYEVLESNNWSKYRPKVVLVEDYEILRTGDVGGTNISKFMLSQGYQFVSHLFDTTIYAEPEFLDLAIRQVRPLNHTRYVSVFYKYGDSPETDARIDAMLQKYPLFTELQAQVEQQINRINDLEALQSAYDKALAEIENSKKQLAKTEEETQGLLQKYYHKSDDYDQLFVENKQLATEFNALKSQIESYSAQIQNKADEADVLKAQLDVLTIETQALLEKYQAKVDEVEALRIEFDGMSKIHEEILPAFADDIELFNKQLAKEIKDRQSKLRALQQDIQKQQNKTQAIQNATQSILNSRSFRYVDQLKSRLFPRRYAPTPLISASFATEGFQSGISDLPDSRRNTTLSPHQVRLTASKLYTLGFVERALEELEYNFKHTTSIYSRHASAWELALWYSQFEDDNNLHRTLNYLRLSKDGIKETKALQKIALVEAECRLKLGQVERAVEIINQASKLGENADLLLARANCETGLEQKLYWINSALKMDSLAPIELTAVDPDKFFYDQLIYQKPVELSFYSKDAPQPKISIILTTYNAEDMIGLAIEAFIQQTWQNWELLLVDDCSTDNTVGVIQSYIDRDDRIKLLHTEQNSGTNVARNIALKVATGEFITCNDADDWSHPQKLEVQAAHLVSNPHIIANMSRQSRINNDLHFYRRPRYGFFIQANISSLMFRRDEVVREIGYWDTVRFLADGEYISRMREVFGTDRVVEIEKSLLSFPRQLDGSLTTHSKFGYYGYQMGISREYLEQYTYFYKTSPRLFIDFPMSERPFAVPEPMLPERNRENPVRHFDVVLISEFRLSGGTVESNIEEIKAQIYGGLKTGLVPLYRYPLSPEHHFDPKVREYIDGKNVEVLVYGQRVTCDTLIIRYPPVLQEWQKYLPDIQAKNIRIIINQTPYRDYSDNRDRVYDMRDCVENVQRYFDTKGVWHPIGPVIRQSLVEHHQAELEAVTLSEDDWLNIIHVGDWKRSSRPAKGAVPRIGRHARDQYVKWPESVEKLNMVYPLTGDYEVHILGGAETVKNMVGEIPANWHVREFNSIHPREFLAELDVFVYYTHQDWIEAFGRVIFEAMATGVPVILPYQYQPLFEDAAIYAEPYEVLDKVQALMNDDNYYQQQVERAWNYVEDKFGYTMHLKRVTEGFPSDKKVKK